MRKLKKGQLILLAIFFAHFTAKAQPTFPENGTADPRHGYYAFTHATIVKDGVNSITEGTLVVIFTHF